MFDKKLFYFFVSFLIFLSGGKHLYGENRKVLEIVKEGNPMATIVIPDFKKPDSPDVLWTKRAAGWLQEYIEKSTGAKLQIVPESKKTVGNFISVGHTNLARLSGVNVDNLKWDSCRLVVKGNILFLIGRDKYGPGKEHYLGAKGTCKAVTTFLEDFLDVRWFLPSPEGVRIPVRKNLIIPGDLNRTIESKFAYVIGRSIYDWDYYNSGKYGYPSSIANNIRCALILKNYGGHSWNVWIPASKYFDKHPEYFIEVNGKRVKPTSDIRGHLCTSNPEVKKIMIEKIEELFNKGYEAVELGQTDGWQPCRCPKCESLDEYKGRREVDNYYEYLKEHPAERIHLFHKAIIDEVARTYPNRKILLLIYGPTRWPSKKFQYYGDNVIGNVTAPDEEILSCWKKRVSSLAVYVYFWGFYRPLGLAPQTSPSGIAEKIKLYRKYNVIGIYLCGGGYNWGLDGPNYFVFSRLLGNPDLNPDKLVKEYCEFAFGKASNTMEQFYRLLYSRSKLYEDRKSWVWKDVYDEKGNLVREEYTPQSFYPKVYPYEIVQQLDELLKKAESEATSNASKKWLKLVRDNFDWLKYNSQMLDMYNRIINSEHISKEELLNLKEVINKRNAQKEKLLKYIKNINYVKKWFPGYRRMYRFLLKDGVSHSVINEPLTWDIDRIINPKSLADADDVEKIIYSQDFENSVNWNLTAEAYKKKFKRTISENGKSGKCIKINGSGNTLTSSGVKLRNIKLSPGVKYRAIVWVKIEKIKPVQNRLYLVIKIGNRYFNSNKYINSSGEWQELSVDFKVPENLNTYYPQFLIKHFNWKNKGFEILVYYVDDVKILQIR